MPYPEFILWQTFYLLEPFGFHDAEYRTAALMATIRNANVSKKSALTKITTLIRDMGKEVLKWLREERAQQSEAERYEDMSPEQKREFIRAQFSAISGKAVEKE